MVLPFLLLGFLIAAVLDVLLPLVDPHAGEEEQPTDCIPRDQVDERELGI